MEIYLIRHTQPDIPYGVCYGQTDLPLKETFEDECQQVMAKLPLQFDAVYTSPLKRCRQLAEQLKTKHLRVCEDLMEINFGIWEMKRWDDVPIESLQKWSDHFVDHPAPQGESYRDVYARSLVTFKEILASLKETVAVVTHAGVIRSVVSFIENIPLKDSFEFKIPYGQVLLVKSDGQTLTIETAGS